MLVRSFGALPCYAPETEAGAEPAVEQQAPPPAGGDAGSEAPPAEPAEPDQPDGPGSGRGKLRKQLEKASADSRKAAPPEDRNQKGQYQSRARQEGVAPDPEGKPEEQPGQQQPAQQQQVAAPEAWSKEAKAVWQQLPPTVQAAVAKRETDMTAGVENLKKGYAELDEAIKPYMGAIQQNKTTAPAAVKQLFGWMDALTREAQALKAGQPPQGVFAALAQSYGIDPVRLLAHMVQNPQGQQQGQPQQQPQQQGQLDPATKAYIDSIIGPVGQGLNQLHQSVQQQSMAKTTEMLGMWAKDKPFYEDVRGLMAKFLSPGPNGEPPVVAPLANGNADLDKAYDMAVYADPAVRAKAQQALQDQQKAQADAKVAAERKAQKDKLEAARKASGSIPISAPGVPAGAKQQQGKRGKSVRESIDEAIAQAQERA